MRPIRLTLHNVRSFRTQREIVFGDMRIFAIQGDTGAGKTSILEAITYALYGRSTWSGSRTKDLIATGTSAMTVSLEFSVDGNIFTVHRILKAAGASTHRLVCAELNIDRSGETEVTAEIRTALGMDADTFLNTVLLPQGQHARLLTANNAEKNNILEDVFGLGDIEDIKDQATRLAGEAAGRIRAAEQQRAMLPLDCTSAVAASEEAVTEQRALVTRATAALERGAAIAEDLSALEADRARVGKRRTAITEIEAALAALERIRENGSTLTADRAQKIREREDATAAHGAAQGTQERRRADRMHTDGLRSVAATLDELAREHAEAEAAQLLVSEAERTYSAASQEATTSEARVAQLATEAAAGGEALVAAETALAALLRDQVAVDVAAREADSANGLAQEQEIAASTAADLVKHLKVADETVAARLASAVTKRAEDQAVYEKARRSSSAADAGAHLHAGDDCPVCQRVLPAKFLPPKAPAKLAALERAAKVAASAYDDLALERHGSAVRLEAAQRNAGEAAAKAKQLSGLARAAQTRLLAVLPKTTGKTDQRAALAARVEAARRSVDSTREVQARAARAHQNAATELAAAKATVAAMDRTRRAAADAVAGRTRRCNDLCAALPKVFAVDGNCVQLESVRATVASTLRSAQAAEAELHGLATAVANAGAALAAIERDIAEMIEGPRATEIERLRVLSAHFDIPALPATEKARVAWLNDAVRPICATRHGLVAEDAVLEARREALVEERALLVAGIGGEPQRMVTEAAIALRDAERARDATIVGASQAALLDRQLSGMQPAHQGLDVLRRSLSEGAFRAYVRRLRQQRLLEQATLIFKEISDDRYEFSESFDIIDRETNSTRSPATLSGGEQFLASLALSLGVVEIAASTGAKIECLFLDEGFASLDAEALSKAMMALRKRAQAGRTIGVISHLREVGEYVDGTFRIDAADDGSTITAADGPLDTDAPIARGLVSQLVTG